MNEAHRLHHDLTPVISSGIAFIIGLTLAILAMSSLFCGRFIFRYLRKGGKNDQ